MVNFSANPAHTRLRFRDLHTSTRHSNASASPFTSRTGWWNGLPLGSRVCVNQVETCGSRVGFTVRLEIEEGQGPTEILIVDWHTNKAKRVSVFVLDIFLYH